MSILIKGGIVVTQDKDRKVLVADVLIDKNKIKSVGKHKASEAD